MAKKILSILCALAMMVTMVSVAAFSASADGEANSTTINLLSSENIGNWNVVRAADNNWSLFSGAVDLSAENINGITGALSLIKTNCNVNPYVDFNYSQAIDFGTDFSILMTDYIKTNVSGTAPTDNSYIALTLGNYSIHLVRFAEDVAANSLSSWNCAEFRVALYKNDSLVKKSELIASATTTTLTDAYSSFSSGTAAGSVALKNASPAGDKTTYVSSGAAYTRESAWKDIKITVENGTLTVYDAKNTVLLTEDVSDSSFDGIKPSVRFYADSTLMKSNPIAVFRFEATINADSTGGETPDPEVPDPEVPTSGTFVGLENATVNHDVLADWSKSGEFNSAVFGETILVAGKKATATFADSYNIGDEFEFTYKMTSVYNQTAGDGVVIKLGKLAISVAGTRDAPHYQVSIAYNGETVATSAESEYPWPAGQYTEDQVADDANYGSTFLDEIHSNVSKALYKDINKVGGHTVFVHTVTCTYKDGKVSVTLFSGPTTTVEAQIDNADFTNAAMSIEVKSSANWYHKAIHNLAGTYTPAAEETPAPLAPTGVYPTLNSDLTLNVIYANAADYKDTVEVTATVEGMSPKTVGLTEKDGYLVASFDFLTPDKFGSEITLNAVDTNGIAESYSTTYSVKQYCKNMMDKDSSSAELKALCMALLQFGDSYAVYKNGSTFLSDMSSYVTAYAPTAWTQGTAAWTYTGTANGAEWVGANLNFAGEIGINVNFKADGDASDYTVDASFGTVSDVIVDGDTFMATIRISSSFLSNQNEVTVMSADGVISEVFILSVEDWVNANIGKMEDAKTKAFVIALMTYGDAAAAYRN